MALPLVAAGVTALGGSVLGALGARERKRQRGFSLDQINEFRQSTLADIGKFESAGRARIAAQGADIVSMSQRRSHAVSASLARSGGGSVASQLTAGVRASGAKAKGSFDAKAFPALGEVVAKQRQQLRLQTMQAMTQLGAEPSVGFGALQGFTQALPGAADLFENINSARRNKPGAVA